MPDPPYNPRDWEDEEHVALARSAGFTSWMAWAEAVEVRLGKKICGAKGKTTGSPCGKAAGTLTEHPKVGRCWLHGGGSKAGREAPNYKDGRYSRFANLRGEMGASYRAAIASGEPGTRADIAFLDARNDTLAASMGEEPLISSAHLQLIQGTREAMARGDVARLPGLLRQLAETLDTILAGLLVMEEIRGNMRLKAQLMQAQGQWEKRAHEPLTRAELDFRLEQMYVIIMEEVATDRVTRVAHRLRAVVDGRRMLPGPRLEEEEE